MLLQPTYWIRKQRITSSQRLTGQRNLKVSHRRTQATLTLRDDVKRMQPQIKAPCLSTIMVTIRMSQRPRTSQKRVAQPRSSSCIRFSRRMALLTTARFFPRPPEATLLPMKNSAATDEYWTSWQKLCILWRVHFYWSRSGPNSAYALHGLCKRIVWPACL